ncbi:MAG: DUF1080 domain-containing protein, partial [Planctomycetales bacterium]|nr:DUF1080 domain-containing protein [Planctomycetales bacterium]
MLKPTAANTVRLILICLVCSMHAAHADTRELFDGETLSGWQGDPNYWRVSDGAIVGEIAPGTSLDHNTWLIWQGEVADFELTFRFRLTGAAEANSGVQFRCQAEGVDHVSGYQADIDKGTVWLGRIYDEHGRALIGERGRRTRIATDGKRKSETFAPAASYRVLFREQDWNDYRLVVKGTHFLVYVNGTLFNELQDEQLPDRDLQGQLAFQLHSGPETKIELRDILLRHIPADEAFPNLQFRLQAEKKPAIGGTLPLTSDDRPLDLGFESGDLSPWNETGDAFAQQPRNEDGISSRWPGQSSAKHGEYFIAGYEVKGDAGIGTLTSPVFRVNQPFATYLVGGGSSRQTRVDLILMDDAGRPTKVIHTASGNDREQMRRVLVDLRQYQGRDVVVRLVDESAAAWGHLNFDDFRFHHERPEFIEEASSWRTVQNPLLQHLVPNPKAAALDPKKSGNVAGVETISQMHVPPGFSVDVIAAEPDLHQPMAFTFDARGRLWVVEGYSYPQKRPDGEGLDRILIFADNDGDGKFETRSVFAEKLNLVSGLEVGYGGVWVGAAPQLLFIPDHDHDDQPDSEPIVLLDGFGYADTHETINSFMWGPDGWLYGNQGVFNESAIGKPGAPAAERTALKAGVWRYHPVRHEFEVFANGGSNQWGLDFDQHGQVFMTHCRSYWGRGLTTHVMQGGHYWNQVNGGYAPFISASAPPERPWLRNYLLASARYGHGEGGAGKQGTREIYGGHSHVGTMIYLGDNWPDAYRNHLFTHNLHGHQLNHQINDREAGGYNTRHAGYDVLLCTDPQYVAVDLQYGPDGAVYISDWYDPRHCHNPNVEHWDRGNGRIYRMQYDATYRPQVVDYQSASDDQLVAAHSHKNEWHVRTARRLLAERAAAGRLTDAALQALEQRAIHESRAEDRLRALWTLAASDRLSIKLFQRAFEDESEYVRAWAVQLATERIPPADLAPLLLVMVKQDESLLVRRALASALQRLPADVAWPIAEQLCSQTENATDRDLPLLMWYGIATHLPTRTEAALELAERTTIPAISDQILWYLAKISPAGRDHLSGQLDIDDVDQQLRYLSLLELALRDMRGVAPPARWSDVASQLYDSSDARIKQLAESLGAVFADEQLFQRMRARLANAQADDAAKQTALAALAQDRSPRNLPLYLAQ